MDLLEIDLFVIYKHTCLASGKSYIGQTCQNIDTRWKRHIYDSKNGSDLHFHRAIRKYGTVDWFHEIIFTTPNQNIISDAEIFLIAYYDTFKTGYNMTKGGECLVGDKNPMFGKTHSFESKDKNRKSQLGKKRSIASIEKQKRTIASKPHPMLGKRSVLWGKPRSEEVKRKISMGKIGEKHPRFSGYYITPMGKFASSRLASKKLKISHDVIGRWCKNSTKLIDKSTYSHSLYLQTLDKSLIGKTFKEIGFDFESNGGV